MFHKTTHSNIVLLKETRKTITIWLKNSWGLRNKNLNFVIKLHWWSELSCNKIVKSTHTFPLLSQWTCETINRTELDTDWSHFFEHWYLKFMFSEGVSRRLFRVSMRRWYTRPVLMDWGWGGGNLIREFYNHHLTKRVVLCWNFTITCGGISFLWF